jgi:hypothetical protein
LDNAAYIVLCLVKAKVMGLALDFTECEDLRLISNINSCDTRGGIEWEENKTNYGIFKTKECPIFEMLHKQWRKKMHWVRCP